MYQRLIKDLQRIFKLQSQAIKADFQKMKLKDFFNKLRNTRMKMIRTKETLKLKIN